MACENVATAFPRCLGLDLIDRYWRAANCTLSVGTIWLLGNPTCTSGCGQAHQTAFAGTLGHHAGAGNFIYAHLSRAIRAHFVWT